MGKDTTAASPREGFSRRGFLTGRPAPAFRPLPPGISMEALSACTGCGDCVAACPQQILSDSRAMQHVAAISDACLARRGVTCMTCRDACPENAIRFAPRAGGPFLPVLDAGLCTGCGACIGPCPSNAIAARPREVAHA